MRGRHRGKFVGKACGSREIRRIADRICHDRALFGTTLSSLRQMTGGMWDGNVPCAQKESTSATSEPIKALTGTSSLRSESEVGKSAAKAQQVNVYRHTDRCSVTKGSQKYMFP